MSIKPILISLFILTLLGCAAAGVLYTTDPKQKISDAYWLFGEKYRALPAEKLLHETIEIYQKNNDEAGLAEAYKAYAIFLRSYSVERWRDRYQERGFIEKSVTYENKYSKSIEYLEKSRDFYEKEKKYDDLTNIYLHMGFTSMVMDNKANGCKFFLKSIEANKTFMSENPDAKIALDGYKSYKDYIHTKMEKAECSN